MNIFTKISKKILNGGTRIKKAFTLIEMILVLIIAGIGSQVIYNMYIDILEGMGQNDIYKKDMVALNNINNLYSFSNNFFDKCYFDDENTVECDSKLSGDTFYIKIVKTGNIYKLVMSEDGTSRQLLISRIDGDQIDKYQEDINFFQLTDSLTGLRYRTAIGKVYIMIFPYNN